MLDKNQVLARLSESDDGARATFYGAPLESLDFQDHVFDGPVNLSGAIFTGDIDFSGAVTLG